MCVFPKNIQLLKETIYCTIVSNSYTDVVWEKCFPTSPRFQEVHIVMYCVMFNEFFLLCDVNCYYALSYV